MEKQIFSDVSPVDRREMLEANSEKVEQMTYSKPLTPEELEKARMDFSQQAIEIANRQDQLKAVTDAIKAEIKPMLENSRSLLAEIRTKHRLVTEEVFFLADHDSGMMCIYNATGELVSSRRLTPEENQLSIHSSRHLRIAQNQ